MERISKNNMEHLTGERLRKAVIAGAIRVIANRRFLDRINVFPVADSDTGSNLAATMKAIVRGLRGSEPSLAVVSSTMAASALEGARGNSGVILAQFLQGLHEGISDRMRLSSEGFVQAACRASRRAREALSTPIEGTILTVIADFANRMRERKANFAGFVPLLEDGLRAARRSVAETPSKLKCLRDAGVVDAGGQGFVYFLEGMVKHLRTGETESLLEGQRIETEVRAENQEVKVKKYTQEEVTFRYCVEAVLAGEEIDAHEVRDRLGEYGDSVIVAGSDSEVHIHLHSNAPADVLNEVEKIGSINTSKTEDMLAQLDVDSIEDNRSGIGIVTDTVCNLPHAFLVDNRVHTIPLRLAFGEEELRDRVDIAPDEFYRRLATSEVFPKTSQPTPAEFLMLYRYLACYYEGIISVHVSEKVSGTYQSAASAARIVSNETGVPIVAIDSQSASGAEGLVVWAVSRAVEEGLCLEDCKEVANAAAERADVYVYVPTLEYFIRGGRISPLAGKIATSLHLNPVLTIRDGKAVVYSKVVGQQRAKDKVISRVVSLASDMKRPMFVIAQSAAPALTQRYTQKLTDMYTPAQVMVTHAAPAVGVHAGPGGVAIAVLDAEPIEQMINNSKTKLTEA